MNLEQLKAKYAKGTEAAKEVQASSTGKVWGATKTAVKATGSFVHGVMPATNRRVNKIAEELNAELNNHKFELFKHDIMIEMIAKKVGVNLPDDETLFRYYMEEEANNQPVAESSESVESFASKVFDAVMSKLKKLPVEEAEVEETKPAKRKGSKNKSKPTPQEAEVIDEYSEEAVEARAKEEALRKEAEKEQALRKETEKEQGDKPKKGRRKLQRKAPITNEEE